MRDTLKTSLYCFFAGALLLCSSNSDNNYLNYYKQNVSEFLLEQQKFLQELAKMPKESDSTEVIILEGIRKLRVELKKNDFWLRYFDPIGYKRINGPIAKEWESEIFEKFEKPYLRLGGGLTLIENYLEEKKFHIDSIKSLIQMSISATKHFLQDSILNEVSKKETFFLANRMFLVNLASIYTTSFECPDTGRIILELNVLLRSVKEIYKHYNETYIDQPIHGEYLTLYNDCFNVYKEGKLGFSDFNHFEFIQKYVDPLFGLNQQMIRHYRASSISFNEFSVSNEVQSIFDKKLFESQDMLGVYRKIQDSTILKKVFDLGKLFFNDPIFSDNNKRSCASCHKPQQYFTDTAVMTSKQFLSTENLARNTPTLVNVQLSPLLMVDGRHRSIFSQIHEVVNNPLELYSSEREILQKVLSCKDYKSTLKTIVKTMGDKAIRFEHISSALSYYIGTFSYGYSSFDNIVSGRSNLDIEVIKGFNLFMGKAQCGTCHYVPTFGGIKAPFISNEFEVIGVPKDTNFTKLSPDSGRYKLVMDKEALFSFRTPSLRNSAKTSPYMHNGVFRTLREVVDFYNEGGGKGRGLNIPNQTLFSEKLNLTDVEKKELILFLESLSEDFNIIDVPKSLPLSSFKKLNHRYVSGEY